MFLDEFGIKSTILLLNLFSIWCTITISFEYTTCVSFYFVNFPLNVGLSNIVEKLCLTGTCIESSSRILGARGFANVGLYGSSTEY